MTIHTTEVGQIPPELIKLAESVTDWVKADIALSPSSLSIHLPVKIRDIHYRHIWLYINANVLLNHNHEKTVTLTNAGVIPHPHINKGSGIFSAAGGCLDYHTSSEIANLAIKGGQQNWRIAKAIAKAWAQTYTSRPLRDLPTAKKCACGAKYLVGYGHCEPEYASDLGHCSYCNKQACSRCAERDPDLRESLHEACGKRVEWQGKQILISPDYESVAPCTSCRRPVLQKHKEVGAPVYCRGCIFTCKECGEETPNTESATFPYRRLYCRDCFAKFDTCPICTNAAPSSHFDTLVKVGEKAVCRRCVAYCYKCSKCITASEYKENDTLCSSCAHLFKKASCCRSLVSADDPLLDGLCATCSKKYKRCYGPSHTGFIILTRSVFNPDGRTTDNLKKICRYCEDHIKNGLHKC